MRGWRKAVVAALCWGSIAVAGAATRTAEVWVTSADGALRLHREPDATPGPTRPGDIEIRVDPAQRFQSFLGVGAAMTDAAALTLQHGLSTEARAQLLAELFGRAPGIGLSFLRVPIGASDFSPRHYTLDDPPNGAPDPLLHFFALPAEARAVLDLTKQARLFNPALRVIASPWSAPAWMKDNGSLVGGHLRRDAHAAFAQYLMRFADAYAAEDVALYALTMENEPGTDTPDYPGMRVDPEQRAAFIEDALGPLLEGRHDAPRLLEWDHNWDAPASPLAVLSHPVAATHVAGVAWHCYYGDVAAQDIVHEAHPDKDAFITECSGGGWAPEWAPSLHFMFGTVLVDGARHWARGGILWNLALDENAGPHLGGCRNCRGVVTIDTRSGAITRNLEYYALAHFGRFIESGAVRIGSTSGLHGLRTAAFQNPSGSLVLEICNDGGAATIAVQGAGSPGRFHLPAGAIATVVWEP